MQFNSKLTKQHYKQMSRIEQYNQYHCLDAVKKQDVWWGLINKFLNHKNPTKQIVQAMDHTYEKQIVHQVIEISVKESNKMFAYKNKKYELDSELNYAKNAQWYEKIVITQMYRFTM